MNVKKELNTREVTLFKGEQSRELADRCPDRRVIFPSSPCTNIGCEYAIQQPGYMNCSFVAAEAGEHTLEAIGEMMGITREGVRLIEIRALAKVRAKLARDQQSDENTTTPQKPRVAARRGYLFAVSQSDQLQDPSDSLPALDDRKLGECGG